MEYFSASTNSNNTGTTGEIGSKERDTAVVCKEKVNVSE
jgi:hypothetical protein